MLTYGTAWTQNKACKGNSIRQPEHKIRHVKEIAHVSMESNIDTISYNKTTSAWIR
jgi:hypothetical protein